MKWLAAVLLIIVSGVTTWLLLTYQAQDNIKPAPPETPSVVDAQLSNMTLRDKISSLLVLRPDGNSSEALVSFVARYRPGGIILMADNLPTDLSTLATTNQAIQANYSNFPLLIAIDQEGDTVKRIPTDTAAGATTLKNLPALETEKAFTERSRLLQNYGINLNFGIVADMTSDPNSFIYNRALGTIADSASQRVAAAVKGSRGKTISTIKHFPGHGATVGDSHSTIPTSDKPLELWKQSDAKPFQAGIDAGVDIVMTGHLRYSAIDSQSASLSKVWIDILRQDLNFKGIIITDDLVMLQNSGDTLYNDPVNNAIAALKAGNTLLLFVANQPNDSDFNYETLIDGILKNAESDNELQTIINDNARKALELRSGLNRLSAS